MKGTASPCLLFHLKFRVAIYPTWKSDTKNRDTGDIHGWRLNMTDTTE